MRIVTHDYHEIALDVILATGFSDLEKMSSLYLNLYSSDEGSKYKMSIICCTYTRIGVCLLLASLWQPVISASSDQTTTVSVMPWLDKKIDLGDARHFFGRTGFGVSLSQLETLAGKTRAEAIDQLIDGFRQKPDLPMPGWVNSAAPRYWSRNDMGNIEKRQFQRARDQEIAELRQWWISNILQTSSPQTERMVLLWHDHFATSYHGVNRQSTAMARQNQTFRLHGMGSYRKFLKAMVHDPALLTYLNNVNNRKGKPNENLARELLELFTLGEGNYTEATVKEAARALTGYAVSQTHNLSFQVHTWKHDYADKTLFGRTGNYDGDALIDLILEQPAASRYLAEKFWHALVSDTEPDESAITQWARAFAQSDFDITTLYRAVLSSEAFWAEHHRLSIVKSPAVILLGTARTLDYPKQQWQQFASLHAQLGMELFAPPNVAGWTEGASFITPGRLLNRYLAVQKLVSTSVTPVKVAPMQDQTADMSMVEASRDSITSAQASAAANMQPDVAIGNSLVAVATGLQIRMAAEDFRGPVDYRIELLRDQEVLWSSGDRTFNGGHNTEMYGRIRDNSSLAWQMIGFEVRSEVVETTDKVTVHFLNDAAGDDGDRNLYVDGIQLGLRWLATSAGSQSSGCPPDNSADAGNLYCAGSVSISVPSAAHNITESAVATPAYSASRARIRWARLQPDKPKLQLEVALEDVQTPDRFYHTLSFDLVSFAGNNIQLRLNSFGCWPDCVKAWPECAWVDDSYADLATLSFPLVASADNDLQCHYDSIEAAEQQLVAVLWNSAEQILEHVKNSKRGRERFADELTGWQKRLSELRDELQHSQYSRSSETILIDKAYTPATATTYEIASPPVVYPTIEHMRDALAKHQLSLEDVLLADVAKLPELHTMTIEQQLTKLVEHPIFQLH